MSTEVITPLTDLAVKINQAHDRAGKSVCMGLEYAREAGEFLRQAKAQLQRGEFDGWIQANVNFSRRTAYYYLSVADRWGELAADSATVARMTYKDSIRVLTAPKEFKALESGLTPAVDPPDEDDDEDDPLTPSAVALDPLGYPLPDRSLPAFATLDAWREAVRLADSLVRLVNGLEDGPGGGGLQHAAHVALRALPERLESAAPHAGTCPACYRPGQPPDDRCNVCSGSGWLTKREWEGLSDELKARLVRLYSPE